MEMASMMPHRLLDNYSQTYQQPYLQYHDMRTHHPSSAMVQPSSAYTNARSNNTTPHSPSAATANPDDAHKPSLPSISNLLGIADGDRATQTSQEGHNLSQQQAQHFAAQAAVAEHVGSSYTSDVDPRLHRTAMPPSPPPQMRSDSFVEPVPSPSTISSQSSISGPSYFIGSSLNNIEPHQQRVSTAPVPKRHSLPATYPQAVFSTSPYGTGPYMTSPDGLSASSYYSGGSPYQQSGLYQQRPLPTGFAHQMMPTQILPPGTIPAANPWQHHHYIGASSEATFPSVQERYICATCKKAFSRPSSLKIHSHSHTGEKPFKCAHAGCGKAFSVRSNMKRHERGCHTEAGLMGSA